MSSEVSTPMSVESSSSRWRTVSMTIGGDDCEDETDVNDLRESLRAWSSLASPSSSAVEQQVIEFSPDCESDFDAVLNNVFADKNRLFQPLSDNTFVEEVFIEKKPKILNGYLFGERIGEGSYGKVKEVLEQDTLVRRAVKIIKEARLRKIPNGHANVEQELRILKRVRHRNVIALRDFFRIDDKQKLYMVLEYCIGSMQQLLDGSKEKKLSEYQAQYFFRQLCDGLSYLHAHGVIHKDIKPGNLLVALDGTLKISDFGVAEMLDTFQAEDWCTVVQGTPKFQPPEIVSGTSENYRGRKVDIWACGITLYNMVSGEYPFEGDVIMRLFDNIANQPLQMPHNVQLSKPLEYLLTAILDKDPERRMNMHDIRRCEWYMQKVKIDKLRRVAISACNNVPAHRPLSIFVQLNQLYGSVLGEDDRSHSSEYPQNMVSTVIIEPLSEDRHVGEQVSFNETKRNRSIA
ncbi:Serine/threonine-protein kinase [Dirofilaria immitis]